MCTYLRVTVGSQHPVDPGVGNEPEDRGLGEVFGGGQWEDVGVDATAHADGHLVL